MTQSGRFTLDFEATDCIFIDDNLTDKSYDIVNDTVKEKSLMELVDLLNDFHEENEKLKKAEILANHRGEMISFATALIDDSGGETMREMWDKFREGKYEEWRKLE